MASIFVIWAFSLRAERDLAEQVAESASQRAVTEVLKLLDMVPEQVFEASKEADERFEEKFSEDFASSSYYHFFSASARHCSKRIASLARQGKLDGKTVLIFVLDPSVPEYLESHARKRIAMQQNGSMVNSQTLNHEIENVRKELFRAILRLHEICRVYDVDLRFHTSYVFFRSEIFETGFFLTFQRGNKPFPGSVYYSRNSPVYEAYRTHFQHHASERNSHTKFSLQLSARSGVTVEKVLESLSCSWTLSQLLNDQSA